MKQCVKDWKYIPYGGYWHFVFPETGEQVTGRNKGHLMDSAKKYAEQHNIPIGLLFEDRVQDLICQAMPDHCGPCQNNRLLSFDRLTMWDVVQGTKNMIRILAANRPPESQEEADRRAEICNSCPFNVTFTLPCAGLCGELRTLAERLVGAKTTRYQNTLRSCGICKCYLTAAVWVPLDIQCAGLNDEQREMFKNVDHCWKKCL